MVDHRARAPDLLARRQVDLAVMAEDAAGHGPG